MSHNNRSAVGIQCTKGNWCESEEGSAKGSRDLSWSYTGGLPAGERAVATPHTLGCCWQFMASIKPQLFNQQRKLKDVFRTSISTWTSHQHTATTHSLKQDPPPASIKTSLVVAKPTLAVKTVHPGETEQLSLHAPTSTETISRQVCWFISR